MDSARTHLHTAETLKARIEAAEREVKGIMADAERRAAPFRLQIDRFRTALDVVLGLDDAAAPAVVTGSVGVVEEKDAALVHGSVIIRESTKTLIQRELAASGLPLSKQELHDRFVALGRADIKDTTVGSTLSNMLKDGLLVKVVPNRYALKPETKEQPEPNDDEL
jgi:hypothetical protein